MYIARSLVWHPIVFELGASKVFGRHNKVRISDWNFTDFELCKSDASHVIVNNYGGWSYFLLSCNSLMLKKELIK